MYRINLRFDLDDERERMAAKYLQQFPQRGKTTRNRFAVDALCAYISRIEQDDRPLLESIRQMLREEIGSASITPTIPAVQTVKTELTVSKVLTDDAIDRIADAILVMQEQVDTMTPVLKQQLQQCEAEIRNVMKAIRQGIITETTKACLEDLEAQRDSLKASILQLQLERRKFTKEEIVEWISKYKYGNINDLDYRKEIIDTFVNSVFVYDDKLVLTYNYKDGTETLTLQEIESVLSSNLTSMCPPEKNGNRDTITVLFSYIRLRRAKLAYAS